MQLDFNVKLVEELKLVAFLPKAIKNIIEKSIRDIRVTHRNAQGKHAYTLPISLRQVGAH